ncbi:hypothetical protein ABEG63_18870 [Chryseobacterium sp. C39-AII1]|uniref:hypothetical protein n=1 Tax=Chryseobacterium sp. C39-AII1 TaxID=3080332 RepID=UPI003208549C
MKLPLILILIIQFTFVDAQLSQKTIELAKPLDTISYAESYNIGIDGEKSKIYGYFQKLSASATNDELYYLAQNGSNSLKLYSSQELFKRNDRRFLEIYKYYFEKPLIMKYQSGCVGNIENISSYLNTEVQAAEEIISLRDLLLKSKKDAFNNSQLQSIYEHGYKNLTQKNIEFVLNEIKKINAQNQNIHSGR